MNKINENGEVLYILKSLKEDFYNLLKKELKIKDYNKKLQDIESDILIPILKEYFTKKQIVKTDMFQLINFSGNRLCIYHISNYLNNQLLRKIIRKELNNIYFNNSVNNLVITFKDIVGDIDAFTFFHIYLKNYLNIKTITFSTTFSKSEIDTNNTGFLFFIVFDYILNNDNITEINILSKI